MTPAVPKHRPIFLVPQQRTGRAVIIRAVSDTNSRHRLASFEAKNRIILFAELSHELLSFPNAYSLFGNDANTFSLRATAFLIDLHHSKPRIALYSL